MKSSVDECDPWEHLALPRATKFERKRERGGNPSGRTNKKGVLNEHLLFFYVSIRIEFEAWFRIVLIMLRVWIIISEKSLAISGKIILSTSRISRNDRADEIALNISFCDSGGILKNNSPPNFILLNKIRSPPVFFYLKELTKHYNTALIKCQWLAKQKTCPPVWRQVFGLFLFFV